jgi:hypothetical protein
MSDEFKQVSKEEFQEFLAKYPRKLEHDCSGIPEPPVDTYNDFSLGVWPESIVARISRDYLGPNGEVDNNIHGKFWTYHILEAKP